MSASTLTVQVLVENTANRIDLLGEHGLSYRIQTGKKTLLFDTGQGWALSHNASILEFDLRQADAIILSHGHYDHTRGLHFFPPENLPPIYAHPGAFQKKYAWKQNHYASVGMPEEIKAHFSEWGNDVVFIERPMQIIEGLWATGPIPRVHEQEKISGPFFLDDQGTQPDFIEDDLSLFFRSQQGVVVLLGCAHAGVINTLHFIQTLTDNAPIHCVMGGMHLLSASPERIQWTLQELQRMNIHILAPCHCTGFVARNALRNSFGNGCIECSAGSEFPFEMI